jgi:hypothetical protein
MNEFTAKKLGEVLAFAVVGKEIFEKGKDALTEVLTAEGVRNDTDRAQLHADAITGLAEEKGVSEITLPKSEKTAEKLRSMLDLYVGDQWDNPAELLEWLGFFEGAALIHWKLVEGAASALGDSKLKELASTGVNFHQNLLTQVSTSIRDLGGKKASA